MAEGDREGVRNCARRIRGIFNQSVLTFHHRIINDCGPVSKICFLTVFR